MASNGSAPSVSTQRQLLRQRGQAPLDAVPPQHPLAPAARAVLESWDGYLYADPIASTTFQAGSVIFSSWLSRVLQDTFRDDFGSSLVGLSKAAPGGIAWAVFVMRIVAVPCFVALALTLGPRRPHGRMWALLILERWFRRYAPEWRMAA